MRNSLRCLGALAFFVATSTPAWAQIVLGQTDTFQDGTTQNWTNGAGGTGISNIASGGPAGAGDRYLQVASGSLGGLPVSLTFNQAQWIGNYAAAGVNAVEMDFANFGTSSLTMRFALRSGTGPSSTPGYVANSPLILPADGVWRHIVFPLDSAHLTPINSPTALNVFLTSVADARILDAANPSLVGDAVSALWGVDNIHAFVVPEPAIWMLLGMGLLGGTGYIAWILSRRKFTDEQIIGEME
jgi:hypothetical protein